MARGFLDIASTPSVVAAQVDNGSRDMVARVATSRVRNQLTERESAFIANRDSFYMAIVSETGWPYVQHRGGPTGFVKVLDDKTLAFSDFRGNRQYISLGNARANNRVALIMVDYPNRTRFKIYATLQERDMRADPDLAASLSMPDYPAQPERAFLLHVEAFDWNCPQHITPRFTRAEIEAAIEPIHARLAALESENAALRAKLNA